MGTLSLLLPVREPGVSSLTFTGKLVTLPA